MEEIVAFEKRKKNKKRQKNIGYIVAIVLLSILLVGTNVMSFAGAWKNLLVSAEPVFALGKQATINVNLNQSSSLAFNFKGSAVMGTVYNHLIYVSMPVTSQRYVLRAKAVVTTGQVSYNATIASDSNWILADDGYCYLTVYALGGQTFGLSNAIKMPDINTIQDKSYNLIVTVESLSENVDFANIWELPDDFVIRDITLD